MKNLHTILSGEITISLHLQFLIRNNKTDTLILKNTKVIKYSYLQIIEGESNYVTKHKQMESSVMRWYKIKKQIMKRN